MRTFIFWFPKVLILVGALGIFVTGIVRWRLENRLRELQTVERAHAEKEKVHRGNLPR